MLRVTKPGGSLSLAVWHQNELNPFTHIVTDVMSRYVDSPPADADAPNAFRFAEFGKLAGIFQIEAPISPSEYWVLRSETSDTLREKLAKLSGEQGLRVKQEVLEAVGQFFPNDQMSFPAQMIIVTGKKAL